MRRVNVRYCDKLVCKIVLNYAGPFLDIGGGVWMSHEDTIRGFCLRLRYFVRAASTTCTIGPKIMSHGRGAALHRKRTLFEPIWSPTMLDILGVSFDEVDAKIFA